MIVPFIGQPALVPGGAPTNGTGDIVLSLFLSPTQSKRAVWGVGPVFALPTTTDPFLGSGKWSMGPTAVVLKQAGPITYGALVNHLWSVANTGNYERTDVNQTYLQPFFNYTTKTAVSLGVSSEASANWEGDGDTWTVPIVFSVSKVTRLGPFPFSLGGGIWRLRRQARRRTRLEAAAQRDVDPAARALTGGALEWRPRTTDSPPSPGSVTCITPPQESDP